MGFTPVLPFRSNGRPSFATPFVTRPSGLAGPAEIGIDHAIAGARVFVDGVERGPVGGRWDGTIWIVPFSGTGDVLRVESTAGVREVRGGVAAGNTYNWPDMAVVSGPTPVTREPRTAGPLRIANMPHGGTVEINGAPAVGGHWVNPATQREWEVDAPLMIRSFSVTDAAGNQRVMTNANDDLNYHDGITYTGWDSLTPNTATVRLVGAHDAISIDGGPVTHSSAPEPGVGHEQIWRYPVPTGAHTFTVISSGGNRDFPITVPPGGMHQIVFVPPSAVAPAPTPRPRVDYLGGLTMPDVGAGTPVARTAPLTVVGPPGWDVAIALHGSTVPLAHAVIPPMGSMTVPVEVRAYDMLVGNAAHELARRTITVPPAGLTVDVRTFYPAAGGGTSPVRTGLRITGLPAGAVVSIDGRVVTGDASGFFPTAPAASVTVQIVAGGVTRRGTIGIPADREQTMLADGIPVVPESTSPPVVVDRGTQGPTVASAGTGELYLTGAPPQSIVTVPGASYTVNDSGRPVLFDLAPATYALTVQPPSGPTRTASVTIAAGQRSPVAYGAMAAPQSQTVELGVCGLIPNPPPGVPENVCDGSLYPSTNGTTYLASRKDGVLSLVPQNAPQQPAEGWSTGAKVAVVLALAAGGYFAWREWGSDDKDGKQENPSKGKCSCGGGH